MDGTPKDRRRVSRGTFRCLVFKLVISVIAFCPFSRGGQYGPQATADVRRDGNINFLFRIQEVERGIKHGLLSSHLDSNSIETEAEFAVDTVM